MIELSAQRKNKITLADYEYRRDIENRLLMAQFSIRDIEVLEEILYSSLNISLRKLAKNLDMEEEELSPILEKLSKTGLLKVSDDNILVDKEMRKYYETQLSKFDEEFIPGMDYLQGLLKKPPIHVLTTWYSIPRASNNIFDSLVEKYLQTPHIFNRYLQELNLGDSRLSGIINDLFAAKDFKLSSKELIEKYNLTREQFEEYLLHLEFNFVCCLGYNREGDQWEEIVTPFHEWREYLRFIRDTETAPIAEKVEIKRTRPHDFSFIQDLAVILTLAKKQPFSLDEKKLIPQKTTLSAIATKCEIDESELPYIQHLIKKLICLKLADVLDGKLYALEAANEWLDMRLENRALFIYRHPLNQLEIESLPSHLCNEKIIREAEKSIVRVLNTGWVYYDNFAKGIMVPLGEDSIIALKRMGKTWKYSLPKYTEEEHKLIQASIFNSLFEIGVVATGLANGKPAFCVTPFGRSLFGR